MTVIQMIEAIAVNEEVRNGRAYIQGTTVTVSDVAMAQNYHAQNVDGIADWYGLDLGQVHAALAYYYSHQAEINGQIKAQIRRAETLKEAGVGRGHSLLPG